MSKIHLNLRLFTLFLFLLMSSVGMQQLYGQQNSAVTGVVTDTQQEPLIGVTVKVKGTQIGTTTGMDGKYSFQGVAPDAVLEFSYIGYQKVAVTVGKRSSIDIILHEESSNLDEIVVVGYGVQRKSDLTGSVGSMQSDDIIKQATTSAAEALRGQIAGVSVVNVGGKPGGDMEIEIRGVNTIGQASPPLIIIDGTETDISLFSTLNPNTIEKVDVLKDASATAVYGSRGSNGVIIVTTKSGKPGKNVVRYDGTYGVRLIRQKPDMMNAEEFSRMHGVMDLYWGNMTRQHRLDDGERANVLSGKTTDWIDMLTNNGMQTSHNLSLSGGNQNETHFINLGYTKEEGNLSPEGFERFSVSLKMSGRVGKVFNMGGHISINYTNTDLAGGEYLRSIYRTRPTTRCFDDDNEPVFWLNTWEQQIPNPYFEKLNSARRNRRFQGWGNIFAEVKPISTLVIRTDFKPSYNHQREGVFEDVFTKANAGRMPAYASLKNFTTYAYTWDNTVNYNQTFGKHKIAATGLFSMQLNQLESSGMEAEGMKWNTLWDNMGASDAVRLINSSKKQSRLMSYMARINYTYDNRYMFTVTGRADGSSRLSKGNKWGFFPSAAVAWVASQESFLKDINELSNLKFRFSYGMSGNDRVNSYSSFMTLTRANYDFGGEAGVGFIPTSLSNKDLRWEKSEEFNIGLDLGLFKNRVSLSADIYKKTTKDLILLRKLPTHLGYENIYDNIGSLSNKGIELSLSTVNIVSGSFQWSTKVNFAMNRNKIIDLYGDKTDDIGNGLFIGNPVKTNYSYIYDGIWQMGEALPDNFSGTITPSTKNKYGQTPGQAKVVDRDGDFLISAEHDKDIIGNADPKWTGGITNTFNYKGFDLSVFVYARYGEQKLSTFHETFASDYSGRFNVLNYDYWTPENTSAKHWAPASQANSEYRKAANYLDCSFVKVGNITLGYEFNRKLLKNVGLSRLRVYMTALNPFVFSKYDGFDPEWAERSINGSSLASTTLLWGVNLSF